jgi:hypothetical protein
MRAILTMPANAPKGSLTQTRCRHRRHACRHEATLRPLVEQEGERRSLGYARNITAILRDRKPLIPAKPSPG